MAIAQSIKELTINLLNQQREYMGNPNWIDTVISELQNSTQSAIYKQARGENRMLISNSFYPSGIAEYDLAQCRVLFNWYNTEEFLNGFNSNQIFFLKAEIGGIEYTKQEIINRNKTLLCYLGTGGADGKITTYTSDPVFSFYRKSASAKEYTKLNGVRFNQFTYANDFFVGCPKPIGTYAIQAADPLFNQSIDYSAINGSLSITTNQSDLDLYSAMHLVDTKEPDGNYLIVDNNNPALYHIFRIYNKNTVFSMFKLWDLDIYYKSVADLNAGTNFYSFSDLDPETPEGPSDTPPGQEENQVDNQFGQGNFESDVITYPSNATMGHGVGMSTYILNSEQLKYVLSKVWDPSIIEILTNFDLSPIVNALIWPCEMYTGRTGAEITSAGVYIGKTPIPFNTLNPNTCYFITNKYLMIKDFGVIRINSKDFYGSFMDFEPYTNAYLYMPCYGMVPFPMGDIIDHDVSVKCCLDISTGAGKYLIFVDNIVKYNFDAQIGVQIQLTNSNFSESLNGLIRNSVNQIMTAPKGAGSIISDGIGNAAGTMNTLEISTVGATGNNNERLNSQECFFAFERSDFAIPKDFNKNYGRPSMITSKLGNLKGFTQCKNVLIETSATEPEKQQIISLLNEGVIIK